MVLEVNFYFLLKIIQARQGKVTFNVLVVASETGNQLALWVTWAMPLPFMFTVKATKAHRQSHPKGEGQGRKDLSLPVPRLVPLHYTRIKEVLHSNARTSLVEGISKQVVIQAEKKGSRGTKHGTRQRIVETRRAGRGHHQRLQGECLLSSSSWMSFPSPRRASLPTTCPRVQLFIPFSPAVMSQWLMANNIRSDLQLYEDKWWE